MSSQHPLLDNKHRCITEKGTAVYLQIESKNLHFYPLEKVEAAA
ncbi:MAG: hypothetical protein ACI9ES_003589 [Oceanospirillaceae bacterium]